MYNCICKMINFLDTGITLNMAKYLHLLHTSSSADEAFPQYFQEIQKQRLHNSYKIHKQVLYIAPYISSLILRNIALDSITQQHYIRHTHPQVMNFTPDPKLICNKHNHKQNFIYYPLLILLSSPYTNILSLY